MSTLLFGNPRIPRVDESGVEMLVNRGMNVWGSGGAHKTYFKKVDEIIVEIFNRPLNRQPHGICDMGCGDGTFPRASILRRQRREPLAAKSWTSSPLILVGVDFNKVARRVAKQTIAQAGIPAYHVITGTSIAPPSWQVTSRRSASTFTTCFMFARFSITIGRICQPADYAAGSRIGRSTGAFAHLGEEIPRDELEENLVRHLRRWAPYVGGSGC